MELPALFFPTVHVHDGVVHDEAQFAHDVYFQVPADDSPAYGEMRELSKRCFSGTSNVGSVVDLDRSKGLLAPDAPVHHHGLRGLLPNGDVWSRGAMRPEAAERVSSDRSSTT